MAFKFLLFAFVTLVLCSKEMLGLDDRLVLQQDNLDLEQDGKYQPNCYENDYSKSCKVCNRKNMN